MYHYEFLSIDYLEQTTHSEVAIIGIPLAFIVVGIVLWSKKKDKKDKEKNIKAREEEDLRSLDTRYAHHEISKEEYERLKKH